MILNVKTISQLNRALENSFGNIKRDMNELKVLLSTQNERNSNIQKEIETVKEDSATKDKINVLKIKLGEVNEDVKKIWDVEKQLKALGQPPKRTFQESLDSLYAKQVATELKLNELGKKTATEMQLKTVVAGANNELNKLSQEIRNIEFRKDVLSNEVVKAFENRIGNKFRQNNEALNDLKKIFKNYVNKDEVKVLVSEINNDFDSVKRELASIQKESKSYVKEAEVKGVLNKINNEFDLVAKELTGIKNQNKDFVTAKQVKGLIDEIGKELDGIKSEMKGLRNVKLTADSLGKSFSQLQREVKNTASRSDVEEILGKSNYGASVVLKKYDKKFEPKKAEVKKKASGKPFAKTYAFGNFLIVIAFLSLLASIGSYYFATETLMDYFAIGAVCSFVVGMVLRMIAVAKGR